jgi:hypothetical protein
VLASHARATEYVVGVTPVPDKVMVEGDPVALLVMVTVPGALPAFVGAKMTLKVSVWPAESPTGVPAPLRL